MNSRTTIYGTDHITVSRRLVEGGSTDDFYCTIITFQTEDGSHQVEVYSDEMDDEGKPVATPVIFNI